MHRLPSCLIAFIVGCLAAGEVFSTEITVERSPGGAVVRIDGQLFTEYLLKSGNKPVLYPIIGPLGKRMTRGYPLAKSDGEKTDHPHQRSLWFSHGAVNGINFWLDVGKVGTIRHLEFTRLASGRPAVIAARNAWVAPDGRRVCEDERTLRFDTDGDARWIDFDIRLKATDGPLNFADTKEGTFGVRVAETMTVDARRGGQMVNSRGQADNAAWGQPAEWIDYHGPIDGSTVGIAILNHPKSFGFPTRWHARSYGLMAANPFCLRGFTGQSSSHGGKTLAAGETMTLRYRVLLHRGDQREGRVREAYSGYIKDGK